ncbi:MAG: hypothetical protein L6Q46_09615 [Flavobacterium sp.]|uniref:hypothetical protein n=1 Tax=Flavobacterium sp. TaxID=239 RepID=UPI0025BEB9DB|nr:hypothetical protein [Flavobacterium sp.]MCK6608539.1 hypothetical protein [Flavobacterium sp.]
MEIPFTYIRNKIRKYSTEDLLRYCYSYIETKKDQVFPIWTIFTLMKWSYQHGGYNTNLKKLDQENFSILYNLIYDFNNNHITNFLKLKIDRGFHILYSQQFYLQKTVYKEVFATQLKIYDSINGKYDINKSFEEKTGLTIYDFIFIQQIVWLFTNVNNSTSSFKYFGYLSQDFINVASEMTSIEKVENFLKLSVLNHENAKERIQNFKRSINRTDLQSLETTFFTIYPFQVFDNQIKVIHKSVYNHFVNYYIYDFLKSSDEKFTTEFGYRFEKYIEFGLKEISVKYHDENKLKKILPKNSNVVDFCLSDSNIYIECKAIEIQAYTSINPTDELLYNSLKDSILKAYFTQMINVTKTLTPNEENWGIILTYKELFWSNFTNLFELGKDKFQNSIDSKYLPPENVFILDIYTWDKIIQIIKDKKATLIEILQLAKSNNSNPQTSKQLFHMHLDIYNLEKFSLSYLDFEIEQLKIGNK